MNSHVPSDAVASARSSQEIYTRGSRWPRREALGFAASAGRAHFSTYGYLAPRSCTYIAGTTRLAWARRHLCAPPSLVVAEEIATLDLLAGGRLDVGLGRGYQHYEFERLGLELESGARAGKSPSNHHEGVRGRRSPTTQDLQDPETMIFPSQFKNPTPPI